MYDYSKLNGRVVEIFGTQARFAEAMHSSENTISKKLNGGSEWKQGEMVSAALVLRFPIEDIPKYFFVLKVQG